MLTVILAFASVAVLVSADQVLKVLVMANMELQESIPVIPGLLSWTYVQNRGAAFGILQNQRWLFVVVTLLLIVGCAFALLHASVRSSKWLVVTLVLIMSGGLGNLVDRVTTGIVVDYISVSFFPPVFNLADCCVVVGAIMAVIYVLFLEPKTGKNAPDGKDDRPLKEKVLQYLEEIKTDPEEEPEAEPEQTGGSEQS